MFLYDEHLLKELLQWTLFFCINNFILILLYLYHYQCMFLNFVFLYE